MQKWKLPNQNMIIKTKNISNRHQRDEKAVKM